ncbi:MAG: glycoside hydrolase family 3 protein, partial [Halieaceae bacterium]|nr:glycoside hydrolase family 3 protein [Halieaceae bacterium]
FRSLAVLTLSISSVVLHGCSDDQSPLSNSNEAEQAARALLTTLTLEQKVGQMIQGEIAHVTPDDLRKYGLGSVLNGGGSFPGGEKNASIDDWLALADAFYQASIDTTEGSAGIPVIWGTDAVHGHNNVVGATLFPHNIGLGAAGDPALVAAISGATAREVKATGIDWIFAPTVAVARDYRWGRTYESYSSDPQVVSSYAGGMVEAMQAEGIVATTKHFVGDGGTFSGVDRGDTRLPLEVLIEEHGAGYKPAIAAGVQTVMASFNSWNGEKVHGNKKLLTDVLRGDLGFDGFVVSDWNGIGEVEGCADDDCPQAINAGIDMVMVPEDWLSTLENLVAQVQSGAISEARIDEAVLRILKIKFESGLMQRGLPSKQGRPLRSQVGSEEHRALARDAVRRSLVLLKNDNQLLPLDPSGHYLVVGKGADNIGMQSGGWTISWQGTGNTNSDFPTGTSLLDGFVEQVAKAGGEVYHNEPVPEGIEVDAVIAVYGESPYAETQGDISSLAWQQPNFEDLALLKQYQKQGFPIVSVFLSGRPLWVNREINASTAFVAAWLPGSEGAGVADVLFRQADGSVQHEFLGRLPMAWPSADINGSDRDLAVVDAAFSRGYGLTSDVSQQVAVLNEEPRGKPLSLDRPVFAGGARDQWRLYLGNRLDWVIPSGPRGGSTKDNQLSVSVIDRRVQEDSRRVEWTGDGKRPSQIYFRADIPINIEEMSATGGAIVMDIRLIQRPVDLVKMRMDCTWPCSGELDVTQHLQGLDIGVWHRLAIPLACFEAAGTNMGAVDVPFLMSTRGVFTIDLAEVTLVEKNSDAQMLNCPTQDVASL